MSYDEAFDEKIKLKKNKCIVNIMKCYQEIKYNGKKVSRTIKNRTNDEKMLKTIIKEIDELFKEIFL